MMGSSYLRLRIVRPYGVGSGSAPPPSLSLGSCASRNRPRTVSSLAQLVRAKGLEPPHLSIPGPKPGASTSSATPAGHGKAGDIAGSRGGARRCWRPQATAAPPPSEVAGRSGVLHVKWFITEPSGGSDVSRGDRLPLRRPAREGRVTSWRTASIL